jgi:8-oxo-dGTP pyrophosphatase MutT (NUDIX family)
VRGATVVVRRGDEYLVLRRVEYHANGDWEWTPPAGTAEEGESPYETAVRELREETGLELPVRLVREAEWSLFVADAPPDAEVVLSDEHDRYEWVSLDDACVRCLPELVGAGLREVAA